MKAIVYTKYGSPDALQLKDIEKPAPKDEEVLLKVYAASVNAYDWHFLTADIFLIRLMGGGLLKPKYTRLGADIAERVEAVGRNVKQFQPDDAAFGKVFAHGFGLSFTALCPFELVIAVRILVKGIRDGSETK